MTLELEQSHIFGSKTSIISKSCAYLLVMAGFSMTVYLAVCTAVLQLLFKM